MCNRKDVWKGPETHTVPHFASLCSYHWGHHRKKIKEITFEAWNLSFSSQKQRDRHPAFEKQGSCKEHLPTFIQTDRAVSVLIHGPPVVKSWIWCCGGSLSVAWVHIPAKPLLSTSSYVDYSFPCPPPYLRTLAVPHQVNTIKLYSFALCMLMLIAASLSISHCLHKIAVLCLQTVSTMTAGMSLSCPA